MTTATKSADELAASASQKILRAALAAGLGGAALRGAISVLRNTNARYNPPEVPKPVVIDMPYPVAAAPPPAAIPLPGKERKAIPALPKFAGESFLERIPVIGKPLHNALPTYTPPMGHAGETDPDKVPAVGAGYALGGLAGGLGGYKLMDFVLRAADRRRAQNDLDAARKEYNQAMLSRVSSSGLPAKAAADANPPPEAAAVRQAIDALYEAVKSAAVKSALGPNAPPVPFGEKDLSPSPGATPNPTPNPIYRTLAGMLWPGLLTNDSGLATANMFALGGMGALGGYAGYNYARDPDAKSQIRRAVKDRDDADANGVPAPIVARLVPVPRQA